MPALLSTATDCANFNTCMTKNLGLGTYADCETSYSDAICDFDVSIISDIENTPWDWLNVTLQYKATSNTYNVAADTDD